jgi:Tfp pilus assembly protein FimT
MELLLVMVIIAVCAGIGAPMMREFIKSRRLPNAAQDVETLARWCRVHAISDATHYRLNIDQGMGRVWVTKDDGTGRNFLPVQVDNFQTDLTMPEGVSISTTIAPSPDDGGTYITFDAGGRSDVGIITVSFEDGSIPIAAVTPLGGYRIVKAGQ